MNTNYALITGASGGIGEAFARALAGRSQSLILVARSGGRLSALKTELEQEHGVTVQTLAMDLAESGSAQALHDRCRNEGWAVSLLVNNAGFGCIGRFLDHPLVDYQRMMALNATALMELSWLFVRDMKARDFGGVINVASTAAFQPTPYFAVYGASKAFVLSFSEALAAELSGTNIRVLALCPGPTRTGFFRVAQIHEVRTPMMHAAEEVVAIALSALESGASCVIPGWLNWMAANAARFIPRRLVLRLAEKSLGRVFRF